MNKGGRGRTAAAGPLVDKNCASVEHYTPKAVVDAVHDYFRLRGHKKGIVLDPCTSADNPTGAQSFFTEADDGLSRAWRTGTFVNPPYGKQCRAAAAKIIAEALLGKEIVALVPCSRSEQAYWQELWACGRITCDVQVRKRLHFMQRIDGAEGPKYAEAKGNPYASQILCFNGAFADAVAAFGRLGMCKEYARVVRWRGEEAVLDVLLGDVAGIERAAKSMRSFCADDKNFAAEAPAGNPDAEPA
jgi:hypothetical protein